MLNPSKAIVINFSFEEEDDIPDAKAVVKKAGKIQTAKAGKSTNKAVRRTAVAKAVKSGEKPGSKSASKAAKK